MRVNALLVRYKDGYRTKTDAAAITADGRIEGFVNYPDATSDEADRMAASTIASYKSPRWQTRVEIEPTGTGDVPMVDWTVGDTITVPDQDGSPAVLRAVGLTITEDDNGSPVYEPQVGAVVETLEERIATTNRSMSAGTLGGRDPQAAPIRGGDQDRAARAALTEGGGSPYSITIAPSDSTSPLASSANVIAPDTTTDMAPFIQAAIDAEDGTSMSVLWLDGQITCGEIVFSGIYGLRMTLQSTQITESFVQNAANTSLWHFDGCDQVVVDGACVIISGGGSSTTSDVTTADIYLDACDNFSMSGVATYGAAIGLRTTYTNWSRIVGCSFNNTMPTHHDALASQQYATEYVACIFDGEKSTMQIDTSSIVGCSFTGPLEFTAAYNAVINACRFFQSTMAAGQVQVAIANFADSVLADNEFRGRAATATDIGAVIEISGSSSNSVIADNTIEVENRDTTSPAADAIRLTSADYCVITANLVKNAGVAGSARSAINVASGSNNNIIAGNDMRSRGTGTWTTPIVDSGTGTLLNWPAHGTYGDNFT